MFTIYMQLSCTKAIPHQEATIILLLKTRINKYGIDMMTKMLNWLEKTSTELKDLLKTHTFCSIKKRISMIPKTHATSPTSTETK